MRVLSNFLMAVGVIAILIFIALVVLYCLFVLTPDIKSEIGFVPVSADAAKSFSVKYSDFEAEAKNAAAEKVKKEIQLVLTNEEVNSKIIEMMAEGTFPFREMLVNFREDACWMYLVTNNPGANAKVGMVLIPRIQNGGIRADVVDFHLGKLPLPKSIKNNTADFISIIINMENPIKNLPVDMTSLEVVNGQLTIKAMTRPSE